jgi:hypothetical protein
MFSVRVGFEPATFTSLSPDPIAQLVERLPSLKKVTGSNPTRIENFFPDMLFAFRKIALFHISRIMFVIE